MTLSMFHTLILVYMTVVGVTLTAMQVDSRLSRRTTTAITVTLIVCSSSAVVTLSMLRDVDTVADVYPLMVHLPVLGTFALLSREHSGRLVFKLFTTVALCMFIQHVAGSLMLLFGDAYAPVMVVYLLLGGFLILFTRYRLVPFYRKTEGLEPRIWWFMSAVIVLYYAIVSYGVSGYVGVDNAATVVKPLVSLLMLSFYGVIAHLVTVVQRASEMQFENDVAAYELSALKARMEAVSAVEEAVRIERHDLKHRLNAVAVLLENGERDRARGIIDQARDNLDCQRIARWCQPPVLDAMLTSYFDQAQLRGIKVDASIEVPSELPVDESRLAIAVGNALDNAIRACAKLPVGERRLSCRVIGHPSLMVKVTNTYRGEVRFDADGLPEPMDDEGHGTGAHSIALFARRCGAVCTFEADDGLFTFRLVF